MLPPFRSTWVWVFLIACLGGLFATGLYGQGGKPDDRAGVVLRANVRTVVVDVVVTGKNGGAVGGLRREDFEVTENGKPQQVTSFEEHTGGKVSVPGTVSSLAQTAPGTARTTLSGPVTVLLLDGLNTQVKDQMFVRKQMFKYLANPVPGQRMAVFALGARLHSVQGFTDDPAVLATVLKNIKNGAAPEPSPLLQSEMEQNAEDQLGELDGMGGGGTGIGALQAFLKEQQAQEDDLRLQITLDAFRQLAQYLGRIPGRKNLVWFSSAFPLVLFPNGALGDPFVTRRDHTDEVKKTDAALAAAQVAIYPIAAEGLATDKIADAGSQMVMHSAYDAQMKQSQSLQSDALERNAKHTAMDEIANDTGGVAYYNGNGLSGALTRVADHGARYYTISYTPTDAKTDGQFRKIKVKVASGGTKLAYRRGYYATSIH